MRASVVIPSWGGAERLPLVLGCLMVQTHPDVEVIVVIDGDIDGSRAVVQTWQQRLNLRIIEFPENRGRVAALNAGLAAATGEVLIRCDDDLLTPPTHVARHVAHHEQAVDAIGVIGLCPNDFPDTPYARVYGRRWDSRFRQFALGLATDELWRLWGANVSVTRATWERVGLYDSTYQGYGFEDVDWGYRLHELGVPIVLDPGLDALHRGPATSTEAKVGRAVASGAASTTFARLHGASALGEQTAPTSLWGRLVHLAGHHLDPDQVKALARVADQVVGHVPSRLGEKVVAFAVESAVVVGREHG